MCVCTCGCASLAEAMSATHFGTSGFPAVAAFAAATCSFVICVLTAWTAGNPDVPKWVADIASAKLAQPGVHTSVGLDSDQTLLFLVLVVYAIVLVALVGQTFGMMVSDPRAVHRD